MITYKDGRPQEDSPGGALFLWSKQVLCLSSVIVGLFWACFCSSVVFCYNVFIMFIIHAASSNLLEICVLFICYFGLFVSTCPVIG